MPTSFLRGLAAAAAVCLLLAPLAAGQAQAAKPAGQAAKAPAAAEKININTASSLELQKLPRVGPRIADLIIQYRTQNGGFKRVEDLMKVRGIGEKTFADMKDLITIGAPQEK